MWPVAESHADAQRLAKWMIENGGAPQDVRPALIGSVEGETLEGHIALAMEDGCAMISCVCGWTDDVSPTWKHMELGQS